MANLILTEAERRLSAIRAVLWDADTNDWRELKSCADAVQDITILLDCPEAALPAPAAPVVWTVFIELDGDDTGYLHGIYGTEALARAAAKVEYDERIARGDVPWVPEGAEPGECNEIWDFDIVVHKDTVIGAAMEAATP